MQLKVIATFNTSSQAEDAEIYLLGNGFTEGAAADESKTDQSIAHNTVVLYGNMLAVYSETSREAQEALDVLNNYGATLVEIFELT